MAKKNGKVIVRIGKTEKQAKPRAKKGTTPKQRSNAIAFGGLHPQAARYGHALINPFSRAAEGARVPQPFAVHSATRKLHTSFTVTTDANGAFDAAIQSHPIHTAWTTRSSLTGGSSTTAQNCPAGLVCRGLMPSLAAIAAIASTYRVVATGLRIKPNTDFTRSGGRIYFATLPASQAQPTAFDLGTTLASAFNAIELPTDGTNITPNIINLPRAGQVSLTELLAEGGLEIAIPIVSPSAWDFLDGTNQGNEQGVVYTSTGGAAVKTFGNGAYTTNGFGQILLVGEGMQASTPVLTLEIIMHIEYTPQVTSSSVLIESVPDTQAPPSPDHIHKVMCAATLQPVASYVSAKAKQMLRDPRVQARAAKFMENGAERVLGLGMRALGL